MRTINGVTYSELATGLFAATRTACALSLLVVHGDLGVEYVLVVTAMLTGLLEYGLRERYNDAANTRDMCLAADAMFIGALVANFLIAATLAEVLWKAGTLVAVLLLIAGLKVWAGRTRSLRREHGLLTFIESLWGMLLIAAVVRLGADYALAWPQSPWPLLAALPIGLFYAASAVYNAMWVLKR